MAAASILARAEFLKRLHFLGREWGLDLPKGAGPPVEPAAVRLRPAHTAARRSERWRRPISRRPSASSGQSGMTVLLKVAVVILASCSSSSG